MYTTKYVLRWKVEVLPFYVNKFVVAWNCIITREVFIFLPNLTHPYETLDIQCEILKKKKTLRTNHICWILEECMCWRNEYISRKHFTTWIKFIPTHLSIQFLERAKTSRSANKQIPIRHPTEHGILIVDLNENCYDSCYCILTKLRSTTCKCICLFFVQELFWRQWHYS